MNNDLQAICVCGHQRAAHFAGMGYCKKGGCQADLGGYPDQSEEHSKCKKFEEETT